MPTIRSARNAKTTTLDAGDSATITTTIDAGAPGSVTNRVGVVTSVADPDVSNSTAQGTITIARPVNPRFTG